MDRGKETIQNIKENYARIERGIVNQLYFRAPHGPAIGGHREEIWEEMFRNIIPKKFVIEHSVFIIDSEGNVSNEVDLAIFDETYTPFVFKYYNLKFIPIEAVAAVIECKSASMEKQQLRDWASSIKQLKTSSESVARIWNKVACGKAGLEKEDFSKTQTATRPLRILCCLNEQYSKLPKDSDELFDVVIRAQKEGTLKIEWNKETANLYEWYMTLNHAGITEETKAKREAAEDWKETIKEKSLSQYQVLENGSELSLMTFNFQLNQILMLINNPILFPHIAYVNMFNTH